MIYKWRQIYCLKGTSYTDKSPKVLHNSNNSAMFSGGFGVCKNKENRHIKKQVEGLLTLIWVGVGVYF